MTILDWLGLVLVIALGVPFCWITFDAIIAMWEEMARTVIGWFR